MSKEIELTQGQVAIIDGEDLERVSAYKWYAHWQARANAFYARASTYRPGKKQPVILELHRFIMGNPKGTEVDHRDGNTMDCRRTNLRVSTRVQNARNRGKQANNTSGFKGVSSFKNSPKWRAHIDVNGKQKHLGMFADPAEAARAYDQAARLHFGEFARLNFPEAGEVSAERVNRIRAAA